MRAVTTVITLLPHDLVALQQVLMDEDKEGALAFLRDTVGEKIACAQDQSHRPEFEGGVRIQEVHKRSLGAGHLPPEEDAR
jgi:hypothetical protein